VVHGGAKVTNDSVMKSDENVLQSMRIDDFKCFTPMSTHAFEAKNIQKKLEDIHKKGESISHHRRLTMLSVNALRKSRDLKQRFI